MIQQKLKDQQQIKQGRLQAHLDVLATASKYLKINDTSNNLGNYMNCGNEN